MFLLFIFREILDLYSKATTVDPSSYQAFHQWGLCNYRAIKELKPTSSSTSTTSFPIRPKSAGTSAGSTGTKATANHEILIGYAVNAASGLLRALSLGTKRWSSSVTQDMLCALSMWFRYSKYPEVAATIEKSLKDVHCDIWLGVLPQLIARIDHPEPVARQMLHNLLTQIGERHSQALVYPLSVAVKSPKQDRKHAAEELMNSVRVHSKPLIDQALLVSQELIRVAILWHEVWHEAIEDASKLYFMEGNVQGMLDTLEPLFLDLKQGPNTIREGSFIAAYGQQLQDAWTHFTHYINYMQSMNQVIPVKDAIPVKGSTVPHLNQAWDILYTVFMAVGGALPNVTNMEMSSCSPALVAASDLCLGVPGTYDVNGTAVKIKGFGQNVSIIRSKQRPRKIKIFGQDGSEFVFLLKGHEDLRQDERAMQLFGLVNALLKHDRYVIDSEFGFVGECISTLLCRVMLCYFML